MPVQTKTTRDTRQFFALVKQHNLDYKEVVFNFTEGRTSSLRELNDTEYRVLVRSLIGSTGSVAGSSTAARTSANAQGDKSSASLGLTGTAAKADKMRKKLIWVLCSMGYLKVQQTGEYFHFENQVTRKANMPDILAVVERLGYLKKPLNSYTVKELPKLVAQFEKLKSNNWKSEANKAVGDLLGPSTSSGARIDKTK